LILHQAAVITIILFLSRSFFALCVYRMGHRLSAALLTYASRA